jgi:bla regulator protein blaR1
MSGDWTQVWSALGVQHLWQSALLLLFASLVLGCAKLSAEARSWWLLGAFMLAAVSPLAVLLPGDSQRPSSAEVISPQEAAPLAVEVAAPRANRGSPATTINQPSIAWLPALQWLALSVWLLGALWSLLRLFSGWNSARRLRVASREAPALQRLMARELPHGATIAFSDDIGGPMVVGLVRPTILVPPALASALAPAVLADLLRHEIAHIHRRDLWSAAVQRLVLSLYWWSPFLKRIGAQLELARELACDERAAAQAGGGADYAGSLLAGVNQLRSVAVQPAVLAVGMFGSRSGLAQRIDGLLNQETQKISRGKRTGWVAVCLIALTAHVGITLAASPRLGQAIPAADGGQSVASANSAQAARLIEAAGAGRLEEVRQLVRGGVDIDARVNGDGTALIQAAKNGQLEMVDELLALGAQPDLHSRGDGNPLIAAASRGHLDVVERLVAAGADVNRVVSFDETPLINAARTGQLPTVKYLVEHGADVNLGVIADGGRWRSPLNQARNPQVWNYLVQQGAVAGQR